MNTPKYTRYARVTGRVIDPCAAHVRTGYARIGYSRIGFSRIGFLILTDRGNV
jgi:hypothetical protein